MIHTRPLHEYNTDVDVGGIIKKKPDFNVWEKFNIYNNNNNPIYSRKYVFVGERYY